MKKMTIRTKSITDPIALRSEMRQALATITGKWKLEILWLLNQRIHPFGELRRAIPGVTQHMLTAQLREIEADGLVRRKIFAEVPPRVEYAITPAARALKPVIDAVFTWLSKHGRGIGNR
jgi:DNA-binding HxlR family transcriptional regulator